MDVRHVVEVVPHVVLNHYMPTEIWALLHLVNDVTIVSTDQTETQQIVLLLLLFSSNNAKIVDDDAAQDSKEYLVRDDDINILEDGEYVQTEIWFSLLLILKDVAREPSHNLINDVVDEWKAAKLRNLFTFVNLNTFRTYGPGSCNIAEWRSNTASR